MDDMPPTNQEPLEQPNGFTASESEITQKFGDSPTDAARLYDSTMTHDPVSGLSAKALEQWIAERARQFEVDGDGLGLMLVAQLALLHNRLRRLMDRPDAIEAPTLLVPWTNAVTKLMAEFRRGYFSLCKLMEIRERKRRREAKMPVVTANGKSRAKKRNGNLIARQQLNSSN